MRLEQAPLGAIVYRGPSMIGDKGPILVAARTAQSSNEKTGNLLQTYILRADISPLEALRRGLDVAICGNCPARGGELETTEGLETWSNWCYVNVGRGPTMVWDAIQRGRYAELPRLADIRKLADGRIVRFGTYGDPGAVPIRILRALAHSASGWRGYTHTWRYRPVQLARFCTASCETESDALEAVARGYRAFSILALGEKYGVRCPAEDRTTTCERCRLCQGDLEDHPSAAPIVTIEAHGMGRIGRLTFNRYRAIRARHEAAQAQKG